MLVTTNPVVKEKSNIVARKRHIKHTSRKITVVLPEEMIDQLGELIPSRHRSQFIADAVMDKLKLLQQAAAFEEAIGIWTDENHPDMQTEEEIDQWLTDLRQGWKRKGEAGNDANSA